MAISWVLIVDGGDPKRDRTDGFFCSMTSDFGGAQRFVFTK
jgi:hypothetical protein